ncbi:hypothetical protein D3C87_62600 [compost metagenome]
MSNTLTLNKALNFFKAFKGDEITFENSYCGTYTDLYSEIHSVGISTLRVKVDAGYTNPDCVDHNNMTDVSIDSIRTIVNQNTPIELPEIDGKIVNLSGFISKNRASYTPSEQQVLEKLLKRIELFFSEVLLEPAIDSEERKIERNRFNSLFIDL